MKMLDQRQTHIPPSIGIWGAWGIPSGNRYGF
jgi:hypothetical protein